jgi:hypothetical protein
MSGRESFDDALDAAIDAMRRGERIDAVLARHPRHAEALRPLLQGAPFGDPAAGLVSAPMSERLADNIAIVRAAVQRAHMAPQPLARPVEQPRVPWWQRRLTFASLSLPAGVFALAAFAGVSGAAAASVAVSESGIPARVAEFVSHPLPFVDSGDGDSKPAASANTPDSNTPGASAAATAGASPSDNAPTLVTVGGEISDVHGNVFTLTTNDGEYKVNVDGTTVVSGTIADGASATVTGDVTAEKNLHADSVDVTAAGDATPTAPGHQNQGGQNTPGNDHTPGPPPDVTPGASSDHTPGPPADHTPGPPGDHTPPGQTTNNGNGNGGVNGNGNGGSGNNGNSGNTNGNGNNNGGGNSKKP